MPTISTFCGIVVYMFFFDNKKHKLPHIHASYGGSDAIFSIEEGRVLDGAIPRKKQKLVQAWMVIHRDELMADWLLAVNGQQTFPIQPLE